VVGDSFAELKTRHDWHFKFDENHVKVTPVYLTYSLKCGEAVVCQFDAKILI